MVSVVNEFELTQNGDGAPPRRGLIAALASVGATRRAPQTSSSACGRRLGTPQDRCAAAGKPRAGDERSATAPGAAPGDIGACGERPGGSAGARRGRRPGPARAGRAAAPPGGRRRSRSCCRKCRRSATPLVITGNAAAVNQVKLIARVVGYLDQIHFQDGALVRKGDLLFTIQQDQYKAQLQQAQAQLQAQQAALVYAQTEVVRYTALLKKQAATQVEVDHWVFERTSAEANIKAAEAQVAIAKLNLELHRGPRAVRRPDGQAPDRCRQRGRRQRPGSGAGRDHAARSDLRRRQCQLAAGVADPRQPRPAAADAGAAAPGADRAQSSPTRRASRIRARSNTSRRRSTRRPARCWCAASCANPDRTLLPGMFVNIRLPMGSTEANALLVPGAGAAGGPGRPLRPGRGRPTA